MQTGVYANGRYEIRSLVNGPFCGMWALVELRMDGEEVLLRASRRQCEERAESLRRREAAVAR